ncbi:MAG TPA: outer membrane beta-barrel protein, partial [Chitinophagaceae bacterium]|nr:outer membrane beta-barrel protein [Chitinophagaceae bacterium]
MKKMIFISSVFFLLFSTASIAQNARIGVTGGLNFSNLSRTIGGIDKDGDYRIGLIGGMMLDVPLCKKSPISFQPDFRYTQKGTAEKLLTPTV